MLSTAAFSELRDLIRNGQGKEARNRLLALQAGCLALQEENRHLRLRLEALEGMVRFKDHPKNDGGLLWIETDEGREGPFCPMCHEADQSLIRLRPHHGAWRCPSCETTVAKAGNGETLAAVLPFDKRRLKHQACLSDDT